MRRYRVVAVDDEQLALRRLEIVLEGMPDIDLVGTATNVNSAIDLIEALRPDVVLLDVAMPGKTGFELIDTLPADILPRIIFVTAFDEYAIEAFERDAVDYVLKPVQAERLRRALERAVRITDLEEQAQQVKGLAASLATGQPAARYEHELWAHRYGELIRVPVANVHWAQAEKDYVRLHTADGSFLLRGTMDSLERRLHPAEFTRIHRSALVRIANVVSVRRRTTGLLVAKLASGEEVNIGRRFAKNFAAARVALRSAPSE